MSRFVIEGGSTLSGTLAVKGSKNAALPLLAAALLTNEPVQLSNIPAITDVQSMLGLLQSAGAKVAQQGEAIQITAADLRGVELAREDVGKLRGSILLLGALLGRRREVTLPRPGGDIIGARPINVHLDAFSQLGAQIIDSGDRVRIDGTNLKAGPVVLQEFSVTATENILLVAATLPGTTTLHIAAAEPHVVALSELLVRMGATISGAGTHTIQITGGSLHGARYTNVPDMLEAGLFIMMAAATQSHLTITNVPAQDLTLFFKKLTDMGARFRIQGTKVQVEPAPLRSFSMQALPYPGIASDLQAPFAVLATQARGSSYIHDPLYEGRFKHIGELQKMGATIDILDPHRVKITGLTPLHGQRITSPDIRAGATLIIAGLVASGSTVIEQAEIIDRGYAELERRLVDIGATIERQE